jgi:hypothetical protein
LTLVGADTLAGTIAGAGWVIGKSRITIGPNGEIVKGGHLALGNLATNAIIGTTSATRLINDGGVIAGAGHLGDGQITLINRVGGVIDGNDTAGLVINSGTNVILNGGTIEATGSGGTRIVSDIESDGLLMAAHGNLTVGGAVTGTGSVHITGAVANFTWTFSQDVSFDTTGELELAFSQSYGGTIKGFSHTGATSLDLRDIAFGAGTTASYVGTKTGGTLTVTDGTHTAHIQLAGNYTASTFTVSSDGAGGTTVVDPAKSAPSAHAFIAAAAGLGAGPAGSTALHPQGGLERPAALFAPRAHLA